MEKPEPVPLKRDLDKPGMLHRIGVATAYYNARSAGTSRMGVLITIPGLPQDVMHHQAQAAATGSSGATADRRRAVRPHLRGDWRATQQRRPVADRLPAEAARRDPRHPLLAAVGGGDAGP